MSVIAFEENWAIGEDFVQILRVRQRLGAEHGLIPSAAQDSVVARMFGGIFAQTFLNVGPIFCAFQVYPAKTEWPVDKMDVTIDETREHKFSAGVDPFCYD